MQSPKNKKCEAQKIENPEPEKCKMQSLLFEPWKPKMEKQSGAQIFTAMARLF